MFQRSQLTTLVARLKSTPRFLQILAGPRQVGKTTLVRQAMADFSGPTHYVSADLPAAPDAGWIEQQWRLARLKAVEGSTLLVLDEVQKVPRWSEAVKMLWDEDCAAGRRLHVVLLGSSQFLMQRGLGESLAGRFELIRVPHWSFAEMRAAFGWDVERYVYFGGYPVPLCWWMTSFAGRVTCLTPSSSRQFPVMFCSWRVLTSRHCCGVCFCWAAPIPGRFFLTRK